jgi:hypothetical protein
MFQEICRSQHGNVCRHVQVDRTVEPTTSPTQDDQVPWVFPDGVWVQALDHLADVMWQFPPKATRRIASATATQLEQIGIEDEESGLADRHANTDAGWSVIMYLSAIRFWRNPWPRTG